MCGLGEGGSPAQGPWNAELCRGALTWSSNEVRALPVPVGVPVWLRGPLGCLEGLADWAGADTEPTRVFIMFAGQGMFTHHYYMAGSQLPCEYQLFSVFIF